MMRSNNVAIRSTSRIMRARLWSAPPVKGGSDEPARSAASAGSNYRSSGINTTEDESLWDKMKGKVSDAWEATKGAADNVADKIMDTGSTTKADGAWEGSSTKYSAGSKIEDSGLKLKKKLAEQDLRDHPGSFDSDAGIASSSTKAYQRGESNPNQSTGMWADGRNTSGSISSTGSDLPAGSSSSSSANFGQRAGLGGADMNEVGKDYSASSSNKEWSDKGGVDGVSRSASGSKNPLGGITGMDTLDSDISSSSSSSSSSSKLPSDSSKWASPSSSSSFSSSGKGGLTGQLSSSDLSSSSSSSSSSWSSPSKFPSSTSKASMATGSTTSSSGGNNATNTNNRTSTSSNLSWGSKRDSLENNTDLSSSSSWASNKHSRESSSVKDAAKDTARMFNKDGKRDRL